MNQFLPPPAEVGDPLIIQMLGLNPLNGKAKFVFADDGNAMLVAEKGNDEDEPLNVCLVLLSVFFRSIKENDENTDFEKTLESAFDAGFGALC